MVSSVNFSNHQWLVKSMDTNKNGKMDELQFDPRIKDAVDTDHSGDISQQELVSALQSDKVEIQQGKVTRSQGFPIYVNGLETLKSVRSTADHGISSTHVWAPNFYTDDTSRDRYHKLVESNQAYGSSIDKMENSLRSIRDMTEGKTDATSRALNIQAKTALNSVRWQTWTARLSQNIANTRAWFQDYTYQGNGDDPFNKDPFANGGNNHSGGNAVGTDPFAGGGNQVGSNDPYGKDPFANGGNNNHNNVGSNDPYGKDPFANGGSNDNTQPVIPVDPYEERLQPYIQEQQLIYNNLQSSYAVMNSALKSIKEQTGDLPDLQASIKGTDASISRAFANLSALENSGKTPQQVASNIRSTADQTEAKATGRTGPFAGIGAGAGAVAGAAIGYFAAGRNLKSAAIGAGIGAAASAGIGALIGNSIDSGYKTEATSLRDLASRVESYNPANDKATVMNANQKLYNELFSARNAHDLDRARVVNNDINSIRGAVNPVTDRTSEILAAHRKY